MSKIIYDNILLVLSCLFFRSLSSNFLPHPLFKSNFNKMCQPLFILHEASLKNIQDGEITYSKKNLEMGQGQNNKTVARKKRRPLYDSITHLGPLQQP